MKTNLQQINILITLLKQEEVLIYFKAKFCELICEKGGGTYDFHWSID